MMVDAAVAVARAQAGDPLAGLASLLAVALAALFAVTALLKLRSPSATVHQFARLHLPAPSAVAGAVAAAELGVAAALVLAPRPGAVLAIAMLTAFTAVIIRTMRRGLAVSCGCLGSLGRRPVSFDAVVRNVALAAAATLAATTTSLHRPDLPAVLAAAGLVLVVSLVMQLVALRDVLDRIWSVELAGEVGRSGRERNL
jgi:uncharacterized membrane protein YphA (DoxX/SURF4 family)